MNLTAVREGVTIALDALRTNKVRALLTILGIVIGVATVVAMAAIVGGIRSLFMEQIEGIGPNNFMVSRWDNSQPFQGGGGRPPWEGKPKITLADGAMIASLPTIRSAAANVDGMSQLKYGSQTHSDVMTIGRGYQWPDYAQGDFVTGRNFLPSDEQRAATVAVLSDELARAVFPGVDPIGRTVRLNGERFEIVGVYRQKPNLFSNIIKNWIAIPPTTAVRRLGFSDEMLTLLVVPEFGVSQQQAMDDVTAALRTSRGLRPGEENDFEVIRQEQFGQLFDRLTGVFFLVMLVLSSVGLMVGGVGVVAIMMISVTERTREIGVRKALGATRREILWQFLVESMTVTVVGGAIGLLLGAGGALLLGATTPIPTFVPLWSVAAALGVAALSGIGFGMIPARRAAGMDPVEALRYE
ncbi:ABC transporter permease [soil metagenome]